MDDPDGYDHDWIGQTDDDVQEGEFADAGDEGGGEGDPDIETVKNTPRPWSAPYLRVALQYNADKKAAKGGDGRLQTDERRALMGALDERLFDGDPAKRVSFLKYVFGVQTSTQLSLAQASTLSDWLNGNGEAEQEAQAVLAAVEAEGDEREIGDSNPRHRDFLGPKTPVAEKPGEEVGEAEQVGLPGMEHKAPSNYDV